MSFYDVMKAYAWTEVQSTIQGASARDVERALEKPHPDMNDFMSLVSPAAEPFLEKIAQRANQITEQRFGKTISLFAPLYLSNFCTNHCRYCGFNAQNRVKRLMLSPDQAEVESRHLYGQGFRHILLVSGEAPERVTIPYLTAVLDKLRPLFASISIELYPMTTPEYGALIQKGADGLVVFQETYHEEKYRGFHPRGRKSDYGWRLGTPERGGAAGFRRLGLGVLLGLDDWRADGFFMALHARYLMKHYWRSQVTLSFPRIQAAASGFAPPDPVSDRDMVQLMVAIRLLLPDAGLVLSTREPPSLRDHLIPLAVTSMSAGSRTDPGGYTQDDGAEAQFDIADHRSAADMAEIICRKGYEPVWKDWDAAFLS
jgi:2-iminoacetate synthase